MNPTGTTPSTDPSPGSVLLVEDDRLTVDAMTQLLRHYGFTVRHASTILEAMPMLRIPPRFALVDLMLPGGGGERVVELIRQRQMKTRVAVLTACKDRERLQGVARLKPELMLAKPIDFLRLLDFLHAA